MDRSSLCRRPDGEPPYLGIGGARILRPQVDEAGVVSGHPDHYVEARPALSVHLAHQGGTDLMLWLRPEFVRDQFFGPRAQAMAHVVPGDDEIGAVLRDAADQQVDRRLPVFQ
jgi:hypothetical protein